MTRPSTAPGRPAVLEEQVLEQPDDEVPPAPVDVRRGAVLRDREARDLLRPDPVEELEELLAREPARHGRPYGAHDGGVEDVEVDVDPDAVHAADPPLEVAHDRRHAALDHL